MGTKDRNFCGATLLAAKCSHLMPMPTHQLPDNGGKSSEDTKLTLFPPPSAVHLLLRFSPHFHQRGLSVDAPAALSPRLRFAYPMELLNTINVLLSTTFLHIWRTRTVKSKIRKFFKKSIDKPGEEDYYNCVVSIC